MYLKEQCEARDSFGYTPNDLHYFISSETKDNVVDKIINFIYPLVTLVHLVNTERKSVTREHKLGMTESKVI